jgi:nicotinate-nucleotide adenylyltransferase
MGIFELKNAKMIGIFGGTFDPVHFGHIKTASYVLKTLNLEQIRMIPLGHAVHRNQPVASPEHRLEMLKAAIDNIEGLIADDREIRRGGGSYTYDTLESVHDEMPDKTLCLITGTDAFNEFTRWFKPDEILQLAHIIVMQRPDSEVSDEAELQQLLSHHLADDIASLKTHTAGKILLLPVPQLPISSTQVRHHVERNLSLDGLLPPSVIDKIRHWQLYSSH